MKTLGYVNQFGRGIETVQDELLANKNGLAIFKFDDITTFKVVVNSADIKTDNVTEANANGTETNVGEKTEKRRRKDGSRK